MMIYLCAMSAMNLSIQFRKEAMSKYKEGDCCKCGTPLVILTNDYAEGRNYCMTCAYDKLMYIPVRIPNNV